MSVDLKTLFPHPEPRTLQPETMQAIQREFEKGTKYLFLEAPTGAGKSALALATARWVGTEVGPNSRSIFVTPQKILQTQYINDFGGEPYFMADLRGRSNYDCNRQDVKELAMKTGAKRIGAHEAPCKVQGRSSLPECEEECPYFQAIAMAQMSPLACLNTSAFLYQANRSNRFEDPRDLIVIDEAHRIEESLLQFAGWSLSGRDLPFIIPRKESAAELLMWLDTKGFAGLCKSQHAQATGRGDAAGITRWDNALKKFKYLKKAVNIDPFVPEYKSETTKEGAPRVSVDIKPLSVRKWAGRLLFDRGDRFLLMSATILDPTMLGTLLGLPPEKCGYIRVPSTFPASRRPIQFQPVGSMKYKEREQTLPHLVGRIAEIMEHHSGERGIIHCQSFWLGERIKKGLPADARGRIIYQKDLRGNGDPRAAAVEKLKQTEGGVLLGPAFHEGLDLVDDLCRFAVIAKVPYPDMTSSAQLKARVKGTMGAASGILDGWKYYQWLTALKLVQSYGRSVRSEEDWAYTYVLDSDFGKFQQQAVSVLPDWFREAIQ